MRSRLEQSRKSILRGLEEKVSGFLFFRLSFQSGVVKRRPPGVDPVLFFRPYRARSEPEQVEKGVAAGLSYARRSRPTLRYVCPKPPSPKTGAVF